MGNNELNYNIKEIISDLNVNISTLTKAAETFQTMTNRLYDLGKTRGGMLSSVDSYKHIQAQEDFKRAYNKVVHTIAKDNTIVNQLDGVSSEDLKKFQELVNSLDTLSTNLDHDIGYKIQQIHSFDTGRLKRAQYSTKLIEDLSLYKSQADHTTTQVREATKRSRGLLSKLQTGKTKDVLSYTFDKDIQDSYNLLFKSDYLSKTEKDTQKHLGRQKDLVITLESRIKRNKHQLKNKSLSGSQVKNLRVELAENQTRLDTLKRIIKKDTEMLDELGALESLVSDEYQKYMDTIKEGTLTVAPSKYSFKGLLKRNSLRYANRMAFSAVSTVATKVQQGNSYRIKNYDNGVSQTMFALSNQGQDNSKLDNKIEKDIDKLGISNGTATSSTDMSKLLGAYTSSNSTGNVNDYYHQVDRASQYSAFTNAGIDATSTLISALGTAGVTDSASVLDNTYSALINSNMLNRSSEQTQALASMVSSLNNVGGLTSNQASDIASIQASMASTHNSSLQGQQGANAYNAFTSTLTNTRDPLMRNIFGEIYGLNPNKMSDNAKLSVKMEQARKSPKTMNKALNKLLKHYNGDTKQAAEYLFNNSNGSLTAHQAYGLMKLVDEGKFSKKNINKVLKSDKSTKGRLQAALQGSGNFKINLYLAVQQKNANNSSMLFDSFRNMSSGIFANHPILQNLAGVGGSAVGSIFSTVMGNVLTGVIDNVLFNNSDKKPPKDYKDSSLKSSHVHTPKYDDSETSSNNSEKVSKVSTKQKSSPTKRETKSSNNEFISEGKYKKKKHGSFLKSSLKENAIFAGAGILMDSIFSSTQENTDDRDSEDTSNNESKSNSLSSDDTRNSSSSISSETSSTRVKRSTKSINDKWLDYYTRGIRVVQNASTISNIIPTEGVSSSASNSEDSPSVSDVVTSIASEETKEIVNKNKSNSASAKTNTGTSKVSSNASEGHTTSTHAQTTNINKNSSSVHARGGVYTSSNDFSEPVDATSYTGRALDSSQNSSALSDLIELRVQRDLHQEDTSTINREIRLSPDFQVDIKLKHPENYNEYVDAVNQALQQFVSEITQSLT